MCVIFLVITAVLNAGNESINQYLTEISNDKYVFNGLQTRARTLKNLIQINTSSKSGCFHFLLIRLNKTNKDLGYLIYF